MNTLSWLLYIAEVSDSLRSVFGGLAFPFGAAAIIGLLAYIVLSIASAACSDQSDRIAVDHARGIAKPILMRAIWPPFILCLLLSSALPSKQTVYYIAASEAGEVVVKSQEAKEIYDLLRGRIKAVLTGPAPRERQ